MQNDNGGSVASAKTWLGVIAGNNAPKKKPYNKLTAGQGTVHAVASALASLASAAAKPRYLGAPSGKTPVKAPSREAAGLLSGRTGMPAAKPAAKAPVKAAPKPVVKAPIVGGSSPYKAPAFKNGPAAPVMSAPTPVAAKPVSPVGSSSTAAASHNSTTNAMQSFIDQAKASVTNDDLPVLNDLQRQLNLLTQQGNADIESTGRRGAATEAGIQSLFDKLGQFSAGVKSVNDAAYGDLSNRTGASYDQLLNSINSSYGAASQAATDESNRLGLGDAASLGGMQRDQAFLSGLAGVDKTNALAGMGNSQQGFDQLMSMMLSNQKNEGASRVSQTKADTNQLIAQIMGGMSKGSYDLNGKMGDIRAQEPQKIRELADALEEKDYSRRTDESDRAFSRYIANSELGLKQQDQALQNAAATAGPTYAEQLDVAMKQTQLDKLLHPEKYATAASQSAAAAKLTPEQRAKQILHGALENPNNPDSNRNMTDLWNIIQTLRLGNYDDDHNGMNDIAQGTAKFDPNDPGMLNHLRYALQNRFHNTDLESTALDIVRALTKKL